tara:strand:+ start:431 stop:1042 length:612 start_codon:yes stop_codon:yes gene_type:complete
MNIHLIAPQDKSKWPDIWHECFESLIKSKHNINIWNDKGIEQLLREDDNEFYNEYLNKLHIIYQIDYVRYIILEKYGGAYFDMDIKIIDDSFSDLLDNNTIYIMEGTKGTYLENSIMISPQGKYWSGLWNRVKLNAKNQIKLHFNILEDRRNVMLVAGAFMLSTFFIKWVPFNEYDILGYYNFGKVDTTISFTKHYQSNSWTF